MKQVLVLLLAFGLAGALQAQDSQLDQRLDFLRTNLNEASQKAEAYKNTIGWTFTGLAGIYTGFGIGFLSSGSGMMNDMAAGFAFSLGLVNLAAGVGFLVIPTPEKVLFEDFQRQASGTLDEKAAQLRWAEQNLQLRAIWGGVGRWVLGGVVTAMSGSHMFGFFWRSEIPATDWAASGGALLWGLSTLIFPSPDEDVWDRYQKGRFDGASSSGVTMDWVPGQLAVKLAWK